MGVQIKMRRHFTLIGIRQHQILIWTIFIYCWPEHQGRTIWGNVLSISSKDIHLSHQGIPLLALDSRGSVNTTPRKIFPAILLVVKAKIGNARFIHTQE